MMNEPETRKKGERPHMDYQMDENTGTGLLLWNMGRSGRVRQEEEQRRLHHIRMSLWRTRFITGIAFYLIGCINEHKKKEILMRWQMAAGAGIITGLELISGIIVNIILGWNVWDYSTLPGNLLGQICPQFTVLWFFLSAAVVYLDDWIRYLLWGEKRPKYKF